MQLVFFCEERFFKGSDGKIYSRGGFPKILWQRYLSVFAHVTVVARVGGKGEENPNYVTDQENVSVIDLPYYVGPREYLKVASSLKKKIADSLCPGSAHICRVPGTIGGIAAKIMRRRSIPYGVEVVGDPWDVFAPGANTHILRPFFRFWGYRNLKKCVAGATAALYVTKNALQARYPVKVGAFNTNASDVFLKKEIFCREAKKLSRKKIYELLSIGSLAQMYKSPDVAIRALKLLKERGLSCRLTWLGDGVFRQRMEALAKELEISKDVIFAGNVSADEVHRRLEKADIFLLVSRTEGLPRALVEAMAHGLPCIGTRVGGIPELLEDAVLIPPENPAALAEKLSEMLENFMFADATATRNLETAREYEDEILQVKREEFYKTLKARFEK